MLIRQLLFASPIAAAACTSDPTLSTSSLVGTWTGTRSNGITERWT